MTDHGVVLDVADVPWAKRQMWDCDCCEKDGKYYLYFPAKDKTDIFRIGVAVSDHPYGPFVPEPDPIRGSYSMDPAVFKDDDGQVYVYFGGLMGGQLQRYRDNSALECASLPAAGEPALPSRVARLTDDMKQFAEEPRAVVVLGADGKPLAADDPHRFLKLRGCTSTVASIIFPTPLATAICSATPWATILTGRLFTKVSSSLQSWAGPLTIPSWNTKASGICSITIRCRQVVARGCAA